MFHSAFLTILTLHDLPSYLEVFSLISILSFLNRTEVSHHPIPSFRLRALSLWSQSRPHLHSLCILPLMVCSYLHSQNMGSLVARKLWHRILWPQYLPQLSVSYKHSVDICGINGWNERHKSFNEWNLELQRYSEYRINKLPDARNNSLSRTHCCPLLTLTLLPLNSTLAAVDRND